MVNWLEVLDSVGGGNTVTLGAVLCVFLYVAADGYVEQSAAHREVLQDEIDEIERRLDAVERWQGAGDRFTWRDGGELARRIQALERQVTKTYE